MTTAYNPSRRQLLRRTGCGIGLLGLAGMGHDGILLPATAASVPNPLAPRRTHFAAAAKRVIWVFVNGGPSQVDTWDYKPQLAKWDGKSMREFDPEFKNTTGFFKNSVGNIMKSPFTFTARDKPNLE